MGHSVDTTKYALDDEGNLVVKEEITYWVMVPTFSGKVFKGHVPMCPSNEGPYKMNYQDAVKWRDHVNNTNFYTGHERAHIKEVW